MNIAINLLTVAATAASNKEQSDAAHSRIGINYLKQEYNRLGGIDSSGGVLSTVTD